MKRSVGPTKRSISPNTSANDVSTPEKNAKLQRAEGDEGLADILSAEVEENQNSAKKSTGRTGGKKTIDKSSRHKDSGKRGGEEK